MFEVTMIEIHYMNGVVERISLRDADGVEPLDDYLAVWEKSSNGEEKCHYIPYQNLKKWVEIDDSGREGWKFINAHDEEEEEE